MFLSWNDVGQQRPLSEILVPENATQPFEEFYICSLDGRSANPSCEVNLVAEGGLVARFYIPRKVLVRAKDAAAHVNQAIKRFSENHSKGKCE